MKRTYQIIGYSAKRNPDDTLNGKMGCHIRLDIDSAAAELDEVKAQDGTTETITASLETHVASQAQRETGETLAAGDVEIFTMLGVDTSFLTMSLGTPTAFGRALMDDTSVSAKRETLGLTTISQAEAEAGTSPSTRAVTAQRIKQAIKALGQVDLIQSQTSVNVSSTDFTSGLSSAYNKVELAIFDWEPVTASAGLEVVLSTNEGTSWAEAAGSYAWVHAEERGGNATRSGVDSATLIELADPLISNVAGEGVSGTIVFHGAKSATARCQLEWLLGYFATSAKLYTVHGHARRLANEDITGIRVRASDGNHSATMVLLGYRDS